VIERYLIVDEAETMIPPAPFGSIETLSDDYIHCKNTSCHVLFISCKDCEKKLSGYCSKICHICDKFPKKVNQFLVGKSRQKHEKQFKKNYKR
jgi:predicted sulfurtransferase